MQIHALKALLEATEPVRRGDVRLLTDEPMHRHTSFRIGGPAALMAVVEQNPEELGSLLAACRSAGVAPFFMGKGSDLLVDDEGYGGLVIQTTANEVVRNGLCLTAQAGAPLARLAGAAADAGLTGLEFAHGIPGSVGGGLMMNAGAYGGELGQVVLSVTCLDEHGTLRKLDRAGCELGYRDSVFARNRWYIASAEFALQPGDPAAIRARMAELQARRREKQPLEYPSAGSAFKRPEGRFAAALIEQCGLKGRTVGGAQVSEKHAGFVINLGGATCRDVIALMQQVRDEVKRQTGVELEPEVKRLGGETAWNLS